MPLPHYPSKNKGVFKNVDPVYKDMYDVIFISKDDINEYKSVESIELNFDLEKDTKYLYLKIMDTFSLRHDFADVCIVVIDLYNGKNGNTIRRKVIQVELTKYRQLYEQNSDSFTRNLASVDESIIELTYKITDYEIFESDDISNSTFENWIRDYKINKMLE